MMGVDATVLCACAENRVYHLFGTGTPAQNDGQFFIWPDKNEVSTSAHGSERIGSGHVGQMMSGI